MNWNNDINRFDLEEYSKNDSSTTLEELKKMNFKFSIDVEETDEDNPENLKVNYSYDKVVDENGKYWELFLVDGVYEWCKAPSTLTRISYAYCDEEE